LTKARRREQGKQREGKSEGQEESSFPWRGEGTLRRKIERLEAIFANITQLLDISRNDRPPTAAAAAAAAATAAAAAVVVVVVVVVVVDDDDDRNSIWLARLEIGRATYPSGCS